MEEPFSTNTDSVAAPVQTDSAANTSSEYVSDTTDTAALAQEDSPSNSSDSDASDSTTLVQKDTAVNPSTADTSDSTAAAQEDSPADTLTGNSDTVRSALDHLQTIRTANQGVLDYFRTDYVTQSERVQALKAELIELDVKLEELKRTKDIYSFQSDNSRTIFSPMQSTSEHQGKGQALAAQIDELQEIRTALVSKVQVAEQELASTVKYMEHLEQANNNIYTLFQMIPEPIEEPEEELPEEEPVEEESMEESEEDSVDAETALHACQILMLHQYDKTQISGLIQSTLTDSLEKNQNKLEVLKWLIQSDPTRARLTIQELEDANEELIKSSKQLSRRLNRSLTRQLPVWKALEELVQNYKKRHPEVKIALSVDCEDYTIQILPILTIAVLQLLQELLENAFRSSGADKIYLQTHIDQAKLTLMIHDNGVGIPSDYLTSSSWHSGLHRLTETIHLFGGTLQVRSAKIAQEEERERQLSGRNDELQTESSESEPNDDINMIGTKIQFAIPLCRMPSDAET